MSKFLVLPRSSVDSKQDYSPEEIQEIINRYHNWAQGLSDQGRLEFGHKLVDGEGVVLRGSGSEMSATDGPFVEVKEVLGGFWIITAEDLADARQLVSECPHLEGTGSLEIRQIQDLQFDDD